MKPTQSAFPKVPDLETEAEARAEDLFRGQSILANLNQIPAKQRKNAETQAYQLISAGEGGEVHMSPASSTHMRLIRGQMATSLLKISAKYGEDEQRCFTIVPPHGNLLIDQLRVNGGAKPGQCGGVKVGQLSGLLRPSSGDAWSHA